MSDRGAKRTATAAGHDDSGVVLVTKTPRELGKYVTDMTPERFGTFMTGRSGLPIFRDVADAIELRATGPTAKEDLLSYHKALEEKVVGMTVETWGNVTRKYVTNYFAYVQRLIEADQKKAKLQQELKADLEHLRALQDFNKELVGIMREVFGNKKPEEKEQKLADYAAELQRQYDLVQQNVQQLEGAAQELKGAVEERKQ